MRVLLSCLALLLPVAARAAEVQVAVATTFAGPLAEIGKGYTAATGHTLKITAGTTAALQAQIAAGAPLQVLIADDETPARLVASGLAVPGSNVTYAIGKLALWSSQPGLVDSQGAVLAGDGYAHLALPDPKTPYGQAAMAVLQARGLAQKLAPKIVSADSVTQAGQWVAAGNAELGFVALSQLLVPGKPAGGSYWLVPAALHAEIRQEAVLLKPGESDAAARALLAWLKSEPAKAVMQIYGYGHRSP